MAQIQHTIHEHLQPMTERFPDQRLKKVAEEMVLGMLGSETPILTQRARHNDRSKGEVWATAKRSYRFDQEQGLDVEDMRVRTVERMRRLFALVLLAAQIVFVIAEHWPPKAVLWLRQLGGKLGLASDRDGPYWLLKGISAVIISAMTWSFVFLNPFPFGEWTYG